ncbi:MAG: FixH family protein [bacterium]|nr:FixH family protein [bacterium]
MKISWGIKIILSFVIFALGIIALVTVSIYKNTDLVSENYYEKELKYQDHIDKLKYSSAMNDNIVVEESADSIIIKYSGTGDFKNMTGDINFYRPSNAGKDFNIKLNIRDNRSQTISKKRLNKGLWKVRLDIAETGKSYFVEKKIMVN